MRGVGGGFSRRTFLERAGAAGVLAMVDVGALLARHGLVEAAAAQTADLTADTLSGLVAFVLPGDDPYSQAQGQSFNAPGGIAAGTVPKLMEALDKYVPASTVAEGDTTIPASGGVATLLNGYATQVNPGASGGGFASPFARLSFADKAEVFRRFEAEPAAEGTELRFVAGILPGFATFLAFSEAGVYDPLKRTLSARPVGWQIASYSGPAEGHAELRGYYRGHRSAIRPRDRQRRRRRRRF